MYFDFSSPRIDEYMRQDAQLWNDYLTCRLAAESGKERASDDRKAAEFAKKQR